MDVHRLFFMVSIWCESVDFHYYLFMKDKLSLRDRTSFSRFSHRFKTDCISDGIAGVEFLSFASAILHKKKESNINKTLNFAWKCRAIYFQIRFLQGGRTKIVQIRAFPVSASGVYCFATFKYTSFTKRTNR